MFYLYKHPKTLMLMVNNLTVQLLETLAGKEEHRLSKYMQLANSFKTLIELGQLAANQRMPSINELVIELDLSKDTIEKAYSVLKAENYISSFRGKGTFVNVGFGGSRLKVLLVFNKMSNSKKKTYEAFAEEAGRSLEVDLLLHDSNISHLRRILSEQKAKYNYFVIIPIFKQIDEKELEKTLQLIPSDKLLLLNKQETRINNLFSVYEDFSEDIFQILEQNLARIIRYRQVELIISKTRNRVFKQIWNGFVRFCLHYSISFNVANAYSPNQVQSHTVYILVEDTDLAKLITDCRQQGFSLGKDVGVIAYNDSPLKAILEGGITVVSTDFVAMGKLAARQIKNRKLENVNVPFSMINRKSF